MRVRTPIASARPKNRLSVNKPQPVRLSVVSGPEGRTCAPVSRLLRGHPQNSRLFPVLFASATALLLFCGVSRAASYDVKTDAVAVHSGARMSRGDEDEAFKKIRALQQGVDAVSARIIQTKRSPLLVGQIHSAGAILLKRPNLLRLTLTEPEQITTVVDGAYMWIYRPKKKEAERYKLSEDYAKAQAIKFLANVISFSAEEIEKRFSIAAYRETEGSLFEMTPKSGVMAKFLTRVTFLFKDGRPVPEWFEVVGARGASTVTEFKDVVINPVTDNDTFLFRPAKDVRITNLQDE